MKDITLIYKNSKILKFTNLRYMFLENGPPVHVNNSRKIKRKHGGVMFSELKKEEYRIVFKKHQLMDKFDSLPCVY